MVRESFALSSSRDSFAVSNDFVRTTLCSRAWSARSHGPRDRWSRAGRKNLLQKCHSFTTFTRGELHVVLYPIPYANTLSVVTVYANSPTLGGVCSRALEWSAQRLIHIVAENGIDGWRDAVCTSVTFKGYADHSRARSHGPRNSVPRYVRIRAYDRQYSNRGFEIEFR